MHDVFISFSFEDQPAAEDIVNHLTNQYGIRCWICTREISGGQSYKSKIVDAIEAAKVIVLIQSAHAIDSEEIPKEVDLALKSDKTIIPFRLDKAEPKGDIKYDLSGINWIDGTKPTFEERIAELADSIRKVSKRENKIKYEETPSPSFSSSVFMHSSVFEHSEIFYGRDALLEDIHDAYKDRHTIFLQGMGGIGKSEIAMQYAIRYKEKYSTIIFARYENSLAALIADDSIFEVRGCARKTRADNTPQTDEEYARDKLGIIRRHCASDTLIIIDNYDVTDDPLMDELARNVRYHVLVTTRYKPKQGKYYTLSIQEIDDEQLKDMFINYADPDNTDIHRDDSAFEELFLLTNRHTLTVKLIAMYMNVQGIDEIDEMVKLLKENTLSVLSDSDEEDGFEVLRSLFRLTKLSEEGQTFLRCLSLMPPAGINQQMFRQWIGKDTFKARSRLVDLGYAQLRAGTLSLHPVVRDIVVSQLQPRYDNCKAFIDRCVLLDQDHIPIMWAMDYETKRMHFDCYVSILKCIDEITEESYPAFRNVSTMYNYIGVYSETIALHQKIHEFACRQYGEYSKQAMLVIHDIGWKHSNTYAFDDALKSTVKAADYFISHPDYANRGTLAAISTCADTYLRQYTITHRQEYYKKALEYLSHAMEYGKNMLEWIDVHPTPYWYRAAFQYEALSRNYARAYSIIGEYAEALQEIYNYREVIDKYKSYLGTGYDLEITDWYRYNGNLQYLIGNYDKAIESLSSACDGYKRFLSLKNPRVLEVLDQIAHCYLKKNQPEEAAKYLRQAIETAEELYVGDHPMLTKLKNLLAECAQ